MDTHDFAMPSPKRQRTESPKLRADTEADVSNTQTNPILSQSTDPPCAETLKAVDTIVGNTPNTSGPQMGEHAVPGENGNEPGPSENTNTILDALMLHVESISHPEPENVPWKIGENGPTPSTNALDTDHNVDGVLLESQSTESAHAKANTATDAQPRRNSDSVSTGMQEGADDGSLEPVNTKQKENAATHTAHLAGEGNILDADKTEATQPTDNTSSDAPPTVESAMVEPAEGAEWEVDSSPYESSSDSDVSSDTTSDDSDNEGVDGDYAMLDPEEQARILMQGDGGSDDEGGRKEKPDSGHLRTANEKVEEIIPKPDIVVTEQMAIEELGRVEGVVEKTVLIKAKVSGEYQVLESGSLLCLQDRSVVGVVAEPLGRVEQPMYTVRFTNDESIKEAGLAEVGTRVYYVPSHSTFVFTQPLRAVKGSDASNFHDEEVGDDEMEFSDDEAEAEHRRLMKQKRQGRRDEQGGRGRGRGGHGNHPRGGRQDFRGSYSDANSNSYGNGPAEISYDDVADGPDDGYTPLQRPANLSEMMAGSEPLEGSGILSSYSTRGHDSGMGRGRGRDRGRGDRGRRGGRGGRGGGNNHPSYTSPYQQGPRIYPQQAAQQQYSPQSMPTPPQFPFQFQQPPNRPDLSQQAHSPQTPFSPSPISPLPPSQQFNFNYQNQQRYPAAHPYQQNQYQQQLPQMPPPGSHINPAFMQNFAQNQQQNWHAGNNGTGWTGNQAAAAQVQAQLEQMRKNGGR